MAYAGEPIGRVVVGLFGEIVPKTVKDFVKLADGTFEENGRFYSYKETSFDQIVKGFVITGGHISVQKRNRGLQRPLFPNENFKLKHYGAGFLSLTNAGQNNPRFCIMLAKADHWDGKHIVFGKVLEGMDVVRRMENVPTNTQAPIVDISVTDCGSLPLERHFAVSIRPVVE